MIAAVKTQDPPDPAEESARLAITHFHWELWELEHSQMMVRNPDDPGSE
jgi:hypothetical protein